MPSHYSLEDELADAVFLNDTDDVRRLLAEGADPDVRDEEQRPVLMNATADGCREIVRLLLEAGADPDLRDADNWNALDVAVYRRSLDMVWLLLQYGAHVNTQPDTGAAVLLRVALAQGDPNEILSALPGGADLPAATAAATAVARRCGLMPDGGQAPTVN